MEFPKRFSKWRLQPLAKFKAGCRLSPDAASVFETEDSWGDNVTVDLAANVLQKLSVEEIAQYHEVEIVAGYSWCPVDQVLA
jgi:hypothetical protein